MQEEDNRQVVSNKYKSNQITIFPMCTFACMYDGGTASHQIFLPKISVWRDQTSGIKVWSLQRVNYSLEAPLSTRAIFNGLI